MEQTARDRSLMRPGARRLRESLMWNVGRRLSEKIMLKQ